MMKLRKRESEFRAAQQTRFSCVLHELCEHFRRKQVEALACVDTALRDVIGTAVDRSQLTPGGWSTTSVPTVTDNVHPKQKKKRKKARKKKSGQVDGRLNDESPQSPTARSSSSIKIHSHRLSVERDSGEHSGATTGSDSSPSQHDRPRLLDCDSDSGSTHDDGPRLSFFSNVGTTGTAASSIASAPALPLSTFGSQPLYSSTTTPFFLSLAPRDHHVQSRVPRRAIDDDEEENQSSPEAPTDAVHEVSSTSESSNFEWYLPSVFSLQTSAHRTVSPTPALDWHFNHWQFKTPESGISDKGVSSSAPAMDPPPPPSSSSSTSSASSRFANTRISGSTRKYSLASFSKIAGMDATRRGSTQVSDHDRQGLTVASIREHGDGTSSVADSDNESDFLYREGASLIANALSSVDEGRGPLVMLTRMTRRRLPKSMMLVKRGVQVSMRVQSGVLYLQLGRVMRGQNVLTAASVRVIVLLTLRVNVTRAKRITISTTLAAANVVLQRRARPLRRRSLLIVMPSQKSRL